MTIRRLCWLSSKRLSVMRNFTTRYPLKRYQPANQLEGTDEELERVQRLDVGMIVYG